MMLKSRIINLEYRSKQNKIFSAPQSFYTERKKKRERENRKVPSLLEIRGSPKISLKYTKTGKEPFF